MTFDYKEPPETRLLSIRSAHNSDSVSLQQKISACQMGGDVGDKTKCHRGMSQVKYQPEEERAGNRTWRKCQMKLHAGRADPANLEPTTMSNCPV